MLRVDSQEEIKNAEVMSTFWTQVENQYPGSQEFFQSCLDERAIAIAHGKDFAYGFVLEFKFPIPLLPEIFKAEVLKIVTVENFVLLCMFRRYTSPLGLRKGTLARPLIESAIQKLSKNKNAQPWCLVSNTEPILMKRAINQGFVLQESPSKTGWQLFIKALDPQQ